MRTLLSPPRRGRQLTAAVSRLNVFISQLKKTTSFTRKSTYQKFFVFFHVQIILNYCCIEGNVINYLKKNAVYFRMCMYELTQTHQRDDPVL